MSIEQLERIRIVSDPEHLATLLAGGLEVPRVFKGSDGNYWALVREYDAWRSHNQSTGDE